MTPTCGPLLILSPALKHWGAPGREALCSHEAYMWPVCDLAPRPEALGRCRWERLCSRQAQLWAISNWSATRSVADPPNGMGNVATRPPCWPLVIPASPLQSVQDHHTVRIMSPRDPIVPHV